ncbi:hypothetical protein EIK56_24955 [Sphingomonas sp. C8-2]|jgi:hypothetical protein|nr:hypothetical protein [Sphingomonas sp. Y57]QEH81155.1 hypothetical protein EIK56_24955 [Sphingomonas sp. C8-2]
MTTDPTRAAEIVVASKEARSAAADLYLAQQGEPHSPHDLATAEAIRSGLNDHWEVVQAFARYEAQDSARLDWLDRVNANMNEWNGTRYGWKYDINHNRAALTDHNWPPLSVREAIDQARERSAK